MASRGLGTLTLDLIARIGGFEKGLDKAARHANKRMKEIEERANKFGKFLGTALAAGATAAVAGMVALTKNAIDSADRLNDISQRLGVGTESLSAWGYAAQQSGTDLEALNTGLTRFTKNVAAAVDNGSRQQMMFEALGVSVKDASGNLRSVENLLPEVAQKFKELDNATLEAALAQELFGRSGANLLQFLNLGGDGLAEMEARARELGIVISQDTASAADEFNDQLANLKAIGTAAGLMLAQELLPAMTQLVVRLREALQEGAPLARLIEWIGDQADATAKDFDFFAGTVRDLSNMFGGLYEGAKATLGVLQGIATLDWSRVRESVRMGLEADNRIADGFNSRDPVMRTGPAPNTGLEGMFRVPGAGPAWSAVPQLFKPAPKSSGGGDSTLQALMDFFNSPTGSGGGKKKTGKSDAEKEAEALARAYESMNERLREQVALFGQDGEAARLRYELEHGELAKLDPLKKAELIDLAEKLDLMREEADFTKQQAELDAEAARAEKAKMENAAQVLSDMQFELSLLGMTNKERERAIALKYADVDASSSLGVAIADMSDKLYEANKASQLWGEFQQSLADTFTDLALNIRDAENIVKSFFDSIAQAITRSIAEDWAETITSWFKGLAKSSSSGGESGGGGNWIGAFLSALGFGGGKATGGGVQAGMFYRVNENGPELLSVGGRDYLMMGSQSGYVTPNRGGGGSLTQIFNVQGTPDRRTAEQMARSSGREARRGMARTGG